MSSELKPNSVLKFAFLFARSCAKSRVGSALPGDARSQRRRPTHVYVKARLSIGTANVMANMIMV
jgi:hypothetical protein